MKTVEIRKLLMNAVLGLATAFIMLGILLWNESLMVIGWIQAITYMLWRYGQTLEKS